MTVLRTSRLKSSTDIYHVILRGINRQQIFFDEEDYDSFIGILERVRDSMLHPASVRAGTVNPAAQPPVRSLQSSDRIRFEVRQRTVPCLAYGL